MPISLQQQKHKNKDKKSGSFFFLKNLKADISQQNAYICCCFFSISLDPQNDFSLFLRNFGKFKIAYFQSEKGHFGEVRLI